VLVIWRCVILTEVTRACYMTIRKCWTRRYSSCGTWWHKRRNQISSFPETDESIQIGGGRQFSRLLAAQVCASALEMLDIPRSEVAWEYWLSIPFASFPFTSPPVRHRVPPGSERALTAWFYRLVRSFIFWKARRR